MTHSNLRTCTIGNSESITDIKKGGTIPFPFYKVQCNLCFRPTATDMRLDTQKLGKKHYLVNKDQLKSMKPDFPNSFLFGLIGKTDLKRKP